MRREETRPPSFPEVAPNVPLAPVAGVRWQVLCGDAAHWRVGLYSPPERSRDDIAELEQHDCPELFLLVDGALTLVLLEGGEERDVPLERGRPLLVTAPHAGYCPNGPFTGTAFVVERDRFATEYRPRDNTASPAQG
jgi:hypothetical protein